MRRNQINKILVFTHNRRASYSGSVKQIEIVGTTKTQRN